MHDAHQVLGKRTQRDYVSGRERNDYSGLTTLGNPVGEIVPASQSYNDVEVVDTAAPLMPTVDTRGTGTVDRGVAYNLRSRQVMHKSPYGSRFDEL